MRVRIIEPILKVKKQKKRVCAYARVSTDSEKQEESLENQIQYYENIISNNPDYEFAGVFADKGITGTTENRPEFQRMLGLARDGKIDLIITKSISRFARNTAIVLETVRQLKDICVEVRFEKENINTLSGDGELMLTVLSSFAQEESKNVSDNLKWRAKKKFEQGELIINTTRFLGYDKDEYGDLIINPKEAEVVRRIFNEYLSGKGGFTIAKELNVEGVQTISRKKWCESSIYLILKNEKYKGDAILQKYYTPDHLKKRSVRNRGEIDSYYIEDNHSAIISREMWEQVQEEIKRRAEAKGNVAGDTYKYAKRYPLTGMLYCSKCGSTLRRRTWNSKYSCKKIVWQCSNYIKNGKDACTGTSIDDDFISRLNIKEEIIVREEVKDGKKHYSYTCKSKQGQSRGANTAAKKENGSLLQSINRPIRTVIKL
ncbi:recombinase family protein [Clostridium magnum]|uniref:Transposon Tn3 resolvase n=1 Tax=Clostridium magnum DSM 2767 TaxID=1121326 RepID=A0A162UJC1_9CLOT|nr:recombinase family protein [Clostridium magnum]KZL93985.1 transposon Tn3 resolvase [Clostridium magnum DSM 2767]SHH99860.1 Site-specific DNA recombinase [Clostridium magnum DSM 2767]